MEYTRIAHITNGKTTYKVYTLFGNKYKVKVNGTKQFSFNSTLPLCQNLVLRLLKEGYKYV